MDMELFNNKYNKVWIFGERIYGFVSVFNIEHGDVEYNCRPISKAHLKEMKIWLFNYTFMLKNYPNFLIIVPSYRSRKPTNFDEVKDISFQVVNGQHTLVACLEYVNEPSNTKEVNFFFQNGHVMWFGHLTVMTTLCFTFLVFLTWIVNTKCAFKKWKVFSKPGPLKILFQ